MSTPPVFCTLFRYLGSTLHEVVSGTAEAPLCLGQVVYLDKVRLTTIEASRRPDERVALYTVQGSYQQTPRLADTDTEARHLRDLQVFVLGYIIDLRIDCLPSSLEKYGVEVVAVLTRGHAVIARPINEQSVTTLAGALKYRQWLRTLPPVSGVRPWNATIPLITLATWTGNTQPTPGLPAGEFSGVREVVA